MTIVERPGKEAPTARSSALNQSQTFRPVDIISMSLPWQYPFPLARAIGAKTIRREKMSLRAGIRLAHGSCSSYAVAALMLWPTFRASNRL